MNVIGDMHPGGELPSGTTVHVEIIVPGQVHFAELMEEVEASLQVQTESSAA